MHEMSIAMQIVETSVAALADHADDVVASVHIRVGAMSNVVPEALQFAWDAATRGTRLDGASLVIEWVPAVVSCEACGQEVELPGMLMKCPSCDSLVTTLVQGRELEIMNLELTDETTHA